MLMQRPTTEREAVLVSLYGSADNYDMTPADLPERLSRRIVIADTDCWEWTGSHTTAGYGNLSWEGRITYIHRVVYTLLRGEIPARRQIDHLCRNRGCCNPAHLEVVTPKENARRGLRSGKRGHKVTHCPQGHEYAVEGRLVCVNHEKDYWGWHCLTCQRAKAAARRARLRDAA